MIWAAAGLGVVGAVALGAGGWFGRRSGTLNDGIDSESHTRLQAVAEQRRANAAADRANLLFIAGGIMLGAGVAVAALDWLVWAAPSPAGETAIVAVGGLW